MRSSHRALVCLVLFVSFNVILIVKFGQRDDEEIPGVKDWMNYKLFVEDSMRRGLGEKCEPVASFDSAEEKKENQKLLEETGFGVLISDKISVNRSLNFDVHPDCMSKRYFSHLPSTSVIVIFHNEVKSVLLRTIHSIFNRTPPELLHEIILVNDFSSDEELYKPLQDYIVSHFPPKVKIKNLNKRSGLIVTRMEGARAATGDVLVFFDSHIEVHHNWLPPLLHPLVENRRIATLPVIDYLNPMTFGCEDTGGLQGEEKFLAREAHLEILNDFQAHEDSSIGISTFTRGQSSPKTLSTTLNLFAIQLCSDAPSLSTGNSSSMSWADTMRKCKFGMEKTTS